jgi:DNA-binding FadR family transcriptional regulator
LAIRPGRSLLVQLRHWLSTAEVPDSGRLPPERALAELFRVTRAELRKALAVLETEGRLRRHVGRGTFLASGRGVSRSRIDELAEATTPRDAMQARLVVEPELARLAALNATTAQIAEMRSLCAQLRRVTTWREYESLDARFHALIAEASGSRLLVEIHHIINGVRRKVVWGHLNIRPVGPSADYHSFNEHDALVEAIANRDRRGAAEAMRQHHTATLSTLMDEITNGAVTDNAVPPASSRLPQPETTVARGR